MQSKLEKKLSKNFGFKVELPDTVESAIDKAFERLEASFKKLKISDEDFDIFHVESSKTWNRIQEIEDQFVGTLSKEASLDLLDKWEKNWGLVLSRRSETKRKAALEVEAESVSKSS